MKRPDPRLERHLLGETPSHLKASTQKRLDAVDAQAELAALQQSSRELLAQAPAEQVAKAIRSKLEATPRPRSRRPMVVGFALASLVLGLAAVVSMHHSVESSFQAPERSASVLESSGQAARLESPAIPAPVPAMSSVASKRVEPRGGDGEAIGAGALVQVAAAEPLLDDGIRLKGRAGRLRIFRIQAPKAALALRDGDTVAAGDLLQVGLAAGKARYLAVFSIDGAGQVTRHLPETGESALWSQAALDAPHSYQLDAAPRFERFVLVTSQQAFGLLQAEAWVRASAAPPGFSLQSIQLSKSESRP